MIKRARWVHERFRSQSRHRPFPSELARYKRWAATVSAVVVVLTGCSGSEPSAPIKLTPPSVASFEEGSIPNCETQVIYEEPCESRGGGGGTDSIDGEITVTASVEWQESFAELPDGVSASVCPPIVFDRLVPGPVTARDGKRFEILTTGTWQIRHVLGPSTASYYWPPGRWPATDGSGYAASITAADAACNFYLDRARRTAGISLDFYKFYGVEVFIPGGPAGGDGGGGSGGGSVACHEEHIVIEINYGDGTGWHVWWEGVAWICE